MAFQGEREGLLTITVDYLSSVSDAVRDLNAEMDELGLSLSEDFINSIKIDAREQAVDMAGEARDLLTEEYLRILDIYYNDNPPGNPPEKYNRTYNLHDNSWEKYYAHSPARGLVYGGIYIGSDNMAEVYHDSASYVFYNSYLDGWHGGRGIAASISDPYGHMDKYLDELESEL